MSIPYEYKEIIAQENGQDDPHNNPELVSRINLAATQLVVEGEKSEMPQTKSIYLNKEQGITIKLFNELSISDGGFNKLEDNAGKLLTSKMQAILDPQRKCLRIVMQEGDVDITLEGPILHRWLLEQVGKNETMGGLIVKGRHCFKKNHHIKNGETEEYISLSQINGRLPLQNILDQIHKLFTDFSE